MGYHCTKGKQGIVRQVSGIAQHSARHKVSRVLERLNSVVHKESVSCLFLKLNHTLFPSYILENTASPPRIPWFRGTFNVYHQFAPPTAGSVSTSVYTMFAVYTPGPSGLSAGLGCFTITCTPPTLPTLDSATYIYPCENTGRGRYTPTFS